MGGGDHGVLGRAVEVDHRGAGAGREDGVGQARVHRLAARGDEPQAGQCLGAGPGDEVEDAGRQVRHGDAARVEQPLQGGGREQFLAVGDDQAGAGQQRAPDLDGRGVGGQAVGVQHSVARGGRREAGVGQHETDHAAVGQRHGLGPAGRTGSEGDVGAVGGGAGGPAGGGAGRAPGDGQVEGTDLD